MPSNDVIIGNLYIFVKRYTDSRQKNSCMTCLSASVSFRKTSLALDFQQRSTKFVFNISSSHFGGQIFWDNCLLGKAYSSFTLKVWTHIGSMLHHLHKPAKNISWRIRKIGGLKRAQTRERGPPLTPAEMFTPPSKRKQIFC